MLPYRFTWTTVDMKAPIRINRNLTQWRWHASALDARPLRSVHDRRRIQRDIGTEKVWNLKFAAERAAAQQISCQLPPFCLVCIRYHDKPAHKVLRTA